MIILLLEGLEMIILLLTQRYSEEFWAPPTVIFISSSMSKNAQHIHQVQNAHLRVEFVCFGEVFRLDIKVNISPLLCVCLDWWRLWMSENKSRVARCSDTSINLIRNKMYVRYGKISTNKPILWRLYK